MKTHRIVAPNTREALRRVREQLGPDAVILKSSNTHEGVEILAVSEHAFKSLETGTTANLAQPALQAMNVVSSVNQASTEKAIQSNADAVLNTQQAVTTTGFNVPMAEWQTALAEVRAMQNLLNQQLAQISFNNGQQKNHREKVQLLRELSSVGFSAALARYLMQHLPEQHSMQALDWVKQVLLKNLKTETDTQLLQQGGIYALLGPTGVGKTTTTAKLAARCVLEQGANKVALITTDGYRIGAHEQLRIYGKMLGIVVHSLKDESDLALVLQELGHKHTILIDTIGMNQRDQRVAQQLAMLAKAGVPIKRLLCLNATATGATLDEVVRSYHPKQIDGCIITKLDEAVTLGNVLDVVIRHKLNLHYLANGQRVPEDLHKANAHYLIDRVFRSKRDTHAFDYFDHELPLLMQQLNDVNVAEDTLGY